MSKQITSITDGNGAPVPIAWVFPGAEECTWVRDEEHWKLPLTPMEVWFYGASGPGVDRAWEEVESPAPRVFRRWQLAGPYLYYLATGDPPERLLAIDAAFRRILARHGSTLGFWRDFCEPRIREAAATISAASDLADLTRVAATWGYGWQQTFTSSTALHVCIVALNALVAEHLGADAGQVIFEVLQGGPNPSQVIDAEVFSLAASARRIPGLAAAIEEGTPAEALVRLRRDPGAAGFVAAFDRIVATHGSRSEGWDLERPTWGEQPEMALRLVRSQLAGGISPEEQATRSSARRAEAVARVHAALPAEDLPRFEALLASLDGYVEVRETRAYWQMVLTGELRLLLLRIGRRLVAEGRLEDPTGILYLVPPDFAEADGSLSPTVARRRADHDRWRAIVPPYQVGVPDPAADRPSSEGETLSGVAASRGQATGPARIIAGPDDWDRLVPGDVLVCALTTPAWTPLFGLAVAVVTEAGDASSHPAITAREYGIPAVLGVPAATTRLRDGQLVTVDGTSGTVVPVAGSDGLRV